MSGQNNFGDWPVADIIIMTDYESPQQPAPSGASPRINTCNQYVRIEMKLSCGDAAALEASIKSGNLDAAHAAILAANGYASPPTSVDAKHARGYALLAAAFGKFDGVIPGAAHRH